MIISFIQKIAHLFRSIFHRNTITLAYHQKLHGPKRWRYNNRALYLVCLWAVPDVDKERP